MLSSRLIKRVPSAKIRGRVALDNWCVNFSKKSKDGSGKANLTNKPGFVTWGLLYEIDDVEIEKLDKIENGYTRIKVIVKKDDGETVQAETYISNDFIDNPIAFDSYKQMLIRGAVDHNLPIDYIHYLQQLPSRPDNKE